MQAPQNKWSGVSTRPGVPGRGSTHITTLGQAGTEMHQMIGQETVKLCSVSRVAVATEHETFIGARVVRGSCLQFGAYPAVSFRRGSSLPLLINGLCLTNGTRRSAELAFRLDSSLVNYRGTTDFGNKRRLRIYVRSCRGRSFLTAKRSVRHEA